ncbi:hypothetical protein [Nocardia alni]|uniref:hypothetical protein n=1 Tax=Nocardia alni TaxID=2815723 RepID=UPI001C219CC1|nr:hypothetical protein [Nocardia alni]
MALSLMPGVRIFSAVDTTEFVVVRAPAEPIELIIGGAPAALSPAARPWTAKVSAPANSGTALGRRYVNLTETIELLCAKSGFGMPVIAGEVLRIKQAAPLFASD